jgi:hypothetical protein
MKILLLLVALVLAPSLAQADSVESLDPLWMLTKLNTQKTRGAALSLCGAELHSCAKAREHLMRMTGQCSSMYRAIIDVDQYPGTPRNLYDTADPQLILFLRPQGLNTSLEPIQVMAHLNPDTIAIAMCPEESRAFGSMLRMFRNIPY